MITGPSEFSALQLHFPGAKLKRRAIGVWPSPLTALTDTLFCLDEGGCSPLYGGNKIRKLEHILGSAHGVTDVITMGAAGSHHVLATAIHCAEAGISTHALLVPQPDTPHVRQTLSRSIVHCASLTPTTAAGLLPAIHTLSRHLKKQTGRSPLVVPIGGSSPKGVLGWISGGLEIADAVKDGQIPVPARVYTALGSGGTAAGLLVGLRLAGLDSEVVAVRVVNRPLGYAWQVRSMARAALRRLRSSGVPLPRLPLGGLRVEDGWMEGGYGVVTARVEGVIAAAEKLSIHADPTYTARCLGAVLAQQAADPAPAVYVHTLNRCPLPPGAPLTPALIRLLT